MDIRSGAPYPASSLSNFAPHTFVVDEVVCASMEGFLQSLKFKNPEMQKFVCSLVGKGAKDKGRGKNWHQSQTLYWQGRPIKRSSREYQELLDRAYSALGQNEGFRKALLATGSASLHHSLGRKNPHETILTVREFTSRLTKLRDELRKVK